MKKLLAGLLFLSSSIYSAPIEKQEEQKIYFCKAIQHNPITALAFSGDNNCLITGFENGMICSKNIQSDTFLRRTCFVGNKIKTLSPGHLGNNCLTADKAGHLLECDFSTGLIQQYNGHTEEITDIKRGAERPDLVLTGSADGFIRIWNYKTGAGYLICTDSHEDIIERVGISPNNRVTASTNAGKLIFFNINEYIRQDLMTHQEAVTSHRNSQRSYTDNCVIKAVSPCGQAIAKSYGQPYNLTVNLMHLNKILNIALPFSQADFVVFSSDLKFIIIVGNNRVFVKSLEEDSSIELKGHTETIRSVNISQDGTLVGVGLQNGQAVIWQIK